jgi:hypothetical protein
MPFSDCQRFSRKKLSVSNLWCLNRVVVVKICFALRWGCLAIVIAGVVADLGDRKPVG